MDARLEERRSDVTRLLAIVKSPDEAAIALAQGADQAAVYERDGSWAVASAPSPGIGAMIWPGDGDHPPDPLDLAHAPGPLWLPAHPDWVPSILRAIEAGRQVIACMDAEMVKAGLAVARQAPVSEVLVARPPFSGRRLVDASTIVLLADAARQCRLAGLPFGFAGALEAPDIPRLQALSPASIGFDSALRDESNRFKASRLQGLAELLSESLEPDARASSALTNARTTLRHQGAGLRGVEAPSMSGFDRIFVRDWMITMSIGAYEGEHGRSQRVRFTVEASVQPGQGGGLADTVSYDLITDAIARIAAAHVDLVEDVAERLAGAVLAHPRVLDLDITVEKLDVGPGSVGCRILRHRRDG